MRSDRENGYDTTPESFGKDREASRDNHANDAYVSDAASETSEKQAGVKRIEAVSKSWTWTSLIIAYVTCVYTSITKQF